MSMVKEHAYGRSAEGMPPCRRAFFFGVSVDQFFYELGMSRTDAAVLSFFGLAILASLGLSAWFAFAQRRAMS